MTPTQHIAARFTRRRTALLCCPLVLFAAAHVVTAQSGRPRRAESPPVVTPTTDAPAKPTPTPSEMPTVSLIVTDYIPAPNVTIGTGIAVNSFVERLRESNRVTVITEKEMRRKDAIDLAKSKTDEHVVWLQMEVDLAGADAAAEVDPESTSIRPINRGCLVVAYAVFAPVTGKTKTQGRAYQSRNESRCTGGVYHPSPYPDGPQPRRMPVEYTLRQAGREAADRVMTAFNIPLPPPHP